MAAPDLDAVFARIPELEEERRFPGLDPREAAALLDEILEAGEPAVTGIIGRLREVDDGADWKARFLLHALATRAAGPERGKERGLLQEVLAGQASGDRPAPVRTFVLQQLQWIADAAAAEKIAPLVADQDPVVADAAAAVLVCIGKESEAVLRMALEAGPGERQAVVIRNALAQIR